MIGWVSDAVKGSGPVGPPDDPPAVACYPELATKEGIANTAYGTAQQAPRLVLEAETVSSVANWHLFE